MRGTRVAGDTCQSASRTQRLTEGGQLFAAFHRHMSYIVYIRRMTPAKTVLLGEFEQITLLALLRLEPDAYGASVQREIEARCGRSVLLASVYTTLDRLETRGS